MHKLIEYICEEIDDLEQKVAKEHKLSMQEIQYLDTLAHTKKNLMKAMKMEEEEEYSNAMSMRGSYNSYGSYGDGSYDGGSYKYPYDTERYLKGGSFARGRGRNANRDSMGRYSSEGGYSRDEEMTGKIRQIINAAPDERTRRQLEELLAEMSN